jgi:hypothetical protein
MLLIHFFTSMFEILIGCSIPLLSGVLLSSAVVLSIFCVVATGVVAIGHSVKEFIL